MPYLTWTFPDTKKELKFKDDILNKLDQKHLLIISTSWYWLKVNEIESSAKEWLEKSPKNKIVTESLYDPYPYKFSFDIEKGRHIELTTKDILFWALYVDNYFTKYSIETVQPKDFKYKFLNYQRRPSPARESLYRNLITENGYATYGGASFEEVFNDIDTLGDLTVWNSSLLNIVSETEIDTSWEFFISEKTFKPIIGLRPFLIYGDPRIEKYLTQLGFKTFNDYFDYNPSKDIGQQGRQIKKIIQKISDPAKVYKDLYQDILFNYEHFNRVVKNTYKDIEKLKEIL